MSIDAFIHKLVEQIWGWPLLGLLAVVSIVFTILLGGVQFKYFFTSWKLAFSNENPKSSDESGEKQITVFQAFINSLGASIGNGNIAGIPAAVHQGGPGAIFWMVVFGFICLSIRYAEVYLGTLFTNNASAKDKAPIGGPMLYLAKIPGGRYLPHIYAFFCFFYTLVAGNAIQCNSIAVGFVRTMPDTSPMTVAIILTAFVMYVLLGGANRIIAASEKLVPLKVGVFLICSTILLGYHSDKILEALQLIWHHAFHPVAIAGGAVGIAVSSAISYGVSFGMNASEVGVGTASVIFGRTEKQDPVKKGIISMLSAFITTHVVCFIVGLSVIVSGVWNNGETSTALNVSAYETVFGLKGGWIVNFYTIVFGLSVVVAYAYIAQECWLFVTRQRGKVVFLVLYTLATIWGTLGSVDFVWDTIRIILATMLLINLYGIMYLLPSVRKGLQETKI
ncbi:MAG: alsT 1 [Chlamydiales bacterium]|jgi:AGCS family alanine or glycine:cation symporter|nr:alsT 1 [Chlamydiales bacterium]